METTVVDRQSVGPNTFTLTFETPDRFDGLAGQFVRLSAEVSGESYARFYTLSSPDTDETFEITVEVAAESGPFSDYLADLVVGDDVVVAGPYGDEYYDGESRAVVLAGGPGVGAAVAIAEAAIAADAEAAVVYQYDGDPAHTDRLDALVDAGADVTMLADGDDTEADDGVDSAEGAEAEDDAFADVVDDALTGADGEGVFVYGFADFVEAAVDAIEAAGGDVDEAKVESFG